MAYLQDLEAARRHTPIMEPGTGSTQICPAYTAAWPVRTSTKPLEASAWNAHDSDDMAIPEQRASINGGQRASINGGQRASINGGMRASISGGIRASINGGQRASINGHPPEPRYQDTPLGHLEAGGGGNPRPGGIPAPTPPDVHWDPRYHAVDEVAVLQNRGRAVDKVAVIQNRGHAVDEVAVLQNQTRVMLQQYSNVVVAVVESLGGLDPGVRHHSNHTQSALEETRRQTPEAPVLREAASMEDIYAPVADSPARRVGEPNGGDREGPAHRVAEANWGERSSQSNGGERSSQSNGGERSSQSSRYGSLVDSQMSVWMEKRQHKKDALWRALFSECTVSQEETKKPC